jgi:hypothetical protein
MSIIESLFPSPTDRAYMLINTNPKIVMILTKLNIGQSIKLEEYQAVLAWANTRFYNNNYQMIKDRANLCLQLNNSVNPYHDSAYELTY